MNIHDSIQLAEHEARATAAVAWAVCQSSRLVDSADRINTFKRMGHGRFDHFVSKSAVTVTDTGDVNPEAVPLPLNSALVALVDAQSILGRFEAAVRVGLNTGVRLQIGAVTPRATAEGDLKPVGKLAFDVAGLPSKISGEIIVSAEALRSLDPATQSGIRQSLVSAVAAATDTFTVETLTTAGTSIGSSDPGDLLAAISGGRPAAPALIGDYVGLLSLGTLLRELRDLGVLLIPTPAATGQLIAVDVSGLLIADGGAEVSIARHANVLLDDGQGSPAGTTVVSLWQKNLESVRAERWSRLAARADAVAYASLGS